MMDPLSDISHGDTLRRLDLCLELLIEAHVQYLALGRLAPVEEVQDRPDVVVVGETHELPIDEVGVADTGVLSLVVVEESVLFNAVKPVLGVLDLALGDEHAGEALHSPGLNGLRHPIHEVDAHYCLPPPCPP